MTNREKLKAAILALAAANNEDGEDHGKVVDSIIENAVQGEIDNGIDPKEFPPQSFVDLITHAARRETTDEIPNETEFYFPLLIYGLHKSNMLLGSQCYFYGEFVSLFLPNLGVGLFADDESGFYEVTDSIVALYDEEENMLDPECYSENPQK